MDISIVVCTWNWAEMLAQCLDHISQQKIPEKLRWEVVVVDNNSTDQTARVIKTFQGRLPLKNIFEAKQGISFARNRSIQEAKGDLILQIDTDALADPNWVQSYWDASKRWPDADYFGGKIRPLFESTPDAWIVKNLSLLEGAMLVRDLGPTERKLSENEQVYGANLAYRARIFSDKKFDVRLGHVGQERLFGEETKILEHVKSEGGFGVWVPRAVVDHFVPDSRASQTYLRRYFTGMGRSQVRLGLSPQAPSFFGAPRPLYRQMAECYLKYWKEKITGTHNWVEPYIRAYELWGMILESRLSTSS